MTKKIDWDGMKTFHGSRPLPGAAQPKYRTGREWMEKAQSEMAEEKQRQEYMAKAYPAAEALLKCRMEDRTPITVVRPFRYEASELVHNYDQQWDDSKGEWVNGEVRNSSFQNVAKSIPVGTQLVIKGLDHNLQEFIFVNQNGEEVVIPYQAKQALIMQTNILDDVVKFIEEQGV